MKVDIKSKGEIASFLDKWAIAGSIKRCMNLRLERWQTGHYKVVCTKDWASRVPGDNAEFVNWDGTRQIYYWPKCPDSCPHFLKSSDFLKTATRDQFDKEIVLEGHESNVVPAPIPRIKAPLQTPEKVTLEWLFRHVPALMWISAISLLLAAFVAGIQATRLKDVRELFNLDPKPVVEASSPSTASPPKTATPADSANK